MKYAYIRDGIVVHVSSLSSEFVESAAVVTALDTDIVKVGYRYDGVAFIPPVSTPITEISPIEFKLRFTSAERVKIRAARATDPAIDDFMDIIDDQHLQIVHLTLPETIGAVTYIINAIKASLAYTQVQADARIAAILS